jgi:hypothetical protein
LLTFVCRQHLLFAGKADISQRESNLGNFAEASAHFICDAELFRGADLSPVPTDGTVGRGQGAAAARCRMMR